MSALARIVPLAISAGFVAANGEEIQELMDSSLDVTRQVAAQSMLNNIRKAVISGISQDRIVGELERGSTFPEFIRSEFVASTGLDAAEDPWGNLYRIKRARNDRKDPVYELSSAGPDGFSGNKDDIWVVLPLK